MKTCVSLFIVLLIILAYYDSATGLSLEDNQTLTRNLQAISTGWVQEAVGSANGILWKAEYKRNDWQKFFSEYLAENSFTDHLRNYLQYPTFGWGPDTAHVELQEGITKSLQQLMKHIMEQHSDDFWNAVNEDPILLETLKSTLRFMNIFTGVESVLSAQTRDELYDFHRELVTQNQILQKRHKISVATFPNLGWIRAQIYINLISLPLQNSFDPKTLTPEIKQQIADTVHLTDKYLDIWNKYSVLIVDNNGLDSTQLSLIYGTLGLVPPTLHNLGVITVWDFLGKADWLKSTVCCINIGGIKVRVAQENVFPTDVTPYYSDVFSNIWVHEFNHVVDYYYVRHDNPRRTRLIEHADSVSMNYLRSMCGDDAFVKGPQEFFASISNQYFANSKHTLELALVRFENGYKEPLNQFLFFADVYSLGSNHTLFYTMDTQGNIERRTVALARDGNGYINSLQVDETRYLFTLDEQGNVTELSIRTTSE